ncbi:MAG TPA: D-alanyl-D-alanine carboxypeptidase, partial [Thermoplasmataceae archaeon]|nr:D-alanyl-D-alanine carboxypeptidase [Thermoplasmataceae archaeon]
MTGVLSYSFIDREGKIIVEKDGGVPLMPASNMKILTGIAAYKFLGEGHKLNTYFSMAGRDLLVSGGPSPLLTAAELEGLAQGIIKMGHEVNRIVIDNSIFDKNQYGPGWMIDDRKYTYQAKISPISVNEGCLPRGWKDADLKDLPPAHTGENLHPVQSQSRSFCNLLWKSLGKTGKPIYAIASDRL